MESFCDAVASAKAPHSADFGSPLMEFLTERLEWGEWALTQAFDVADKLACKRPARSGVAVFEQQELTEALPHFVQNAG